MKIYELEQLPYFSIQEIRNIFWQKADITIKEILVREVKNKSIYRLKKGFYVSDNFLKYKKSSWYEYFIANQIYWPSYISWVTALDYYWIFSESSFGIVSITSNKTFKISNIVWQFIYKNIKSELFQWFENIRIWDYEVYFATKAKALFDYLRYQKSKIQKFTIENIESFRLNFDILKKKDIEEFKKYCVLSGSEKMINIYNLIKEKCEQKM